MKKFVDEVNDLFSYVISEEDVCLEDAEVCVRDTFHSLEQMLLEVCVSITAAKKASEPVAYPECQKSCAALRKQRKYFTTLCGKIGVNRWVYQCEEGHRHAPWDVAQQLLDTYTHRVAEVMCRLAVHLDFREAASELSRQGIEVSRTTLQKKVGAWSEALRVSEEVAPLTLQNNENGM